MDINWFCWVVFGGGNKLWEDEVEVRFEVECCRGSSFKWGGEVEEKKRGSIILWLGRVLIILGQGRSVG